MKKYLSTILIAAMILGVGGVVLVPETVNAAEGIIERIAISGINNAIAGFGNFFLGLTSTFVALTGSLLSVSINLTTHIKDI